MCMIQLYVSSKVKKQTYVDIQVGTPIIGDRTGSWARLEARVATGERLIMQLSGSSLKW